MPSGVRAPVSSSVTVTTSSSSVVEVRTGSVSYTHLDVYKRQVLLRAYLGESLIILMMLSIILGIIIANRE